MLISGASSCPPPPARPLGHSEILAEARRKHVSGRTSPDYYVIQFFSCVRDSSSDPATLRIDIGAPLIPLWKHVVLIPLSVVSNQIRGHRPAVFAIRHAQKHGSERGSVSRLRSLVGAEEVCRIVLGLEFDQSCVIAPKRAPDEIRVFVPEEIQWVGVA
jgi:hypothetical protein